MKTITLLLSSLVLISSLSSAQSAIIDLDINNVRAKLLNGGDMFWTPMSGASGYEFPKGSNKNAMFASSIWIAGVDSSTHSLHVAAQTYRQSGNDYWPGPIDVAGATDTTVVLRWDRFWKINKVDIDTFMATVGHTLSNTPTSILDWPAKGNINALDALSNPLAINKNMAPFVDVNSDGIYNPLDGDYPEIKGHQAVWWVYNDKKVHHNTGGAAFGLEIKVMAYACATNDALNDATFYDYEISNISSNTYDSVRIGFWNDMDLGFAFDDYIGYDSSRRMAIAYNGQANDAVYGTSLTQTGAIVLSTPNDTGSIKEPLGAFTYYDNLFGPNGNPQTATAYRNILNGKMTSGTPFRRSCTTSTSAPIVQFVYPDEPNLVSGWSERQCTNTPGDRRSIMSTRDFKLRPNETVKYNMAIVNSPAGSNNIDFSALKTAADVVIANTKGCNFVSDVINVHANNDIIVYPNPVSNKLTIIWKDQEVNEIEMIDAVGKIIYRLDAAKMLNVNIDMTSFAKGNYIVRLSSPKGLLARKITKN